MKKFFFAVMFVVTLTLASTCAAKDVWVENYNGVDTYVMDDTITSNTSGNGKSFSVSVKQVRNGQLQKVVTCNYFKYEDDMWREHVKDHSVVLHPINKVFEFCMNRLGWSYRIDASDPIVKRYY